MAERFRHEYKYPIDARQDAILSLLAAASMPRDPHAGSEGTYIIRSLYFDDQFDSRAMENESGTDPRSKFRIRRYNDDCIHLRLEKKTKARGMTLKESCQLTPEECRTLMEGRWITVSNAMPPEKQALLMELQSQSLLPKVIVTYEREPFVYAGGNVRVTFDRKITSSGDTSHFLENTYSQRPIFSLGQSLMEVKWDEILPEYLHRMLQLDTLQWSAFSKYFLCRTYHL